MIRLTFAALAAIAGLSSCADAPTASPSLYRVGAAYSLQGHGRWDLLGIDSGRRHVFISRGDRVQVMDADDGQLAGTLDGTDGVHGIAIAANIGRGFATDGHAAAVTEFDLESLRRIRDIPVSGKSPDAVLFDPFSQRLYVFNARSNNASVIDPRSGNEIATIAFEGNPELPASDDAGHVFVNIEDKAELVDIDTRKMRVVHTWNLSGCEEPTGLAIDSAHARLFSACQNGVMVVTDALDGHQVARVEIGEGPDGAAFDPKAQIAFVPNGKSGTLTIVHEDDPAHFRVIQTLPTQRSARTVALDPSTGRLYLPAADFEPQPADSEAWPEMVSGSFRVLTVWPQPN